MQARGQGATASADCLSEPAPYAGPLASLRRHLLASGDVLKALMHTLQRPPSSKSYTQGRFES